MELERVVTGQCGRPDRFASVRSNLVLGYAAQALAGAIVSASLVIGWLACVPVIPAHENSARIAVAPAEDSFEVAAHTLLGLELASAQRVETLERLVAPMTSLDLALTVHLVICLGTHEVSFVAILLARPAVHVVDEIEARVLARERLEQRVARPYLRFDRSIWVVRVEIHGGDGIARGRRVLRIAAALRPVGGPGAPEVDDG